MMAMFPRSVIVVTLLAFTAHADEAVRRDGSRTNGTLSLTANKSLAFQNATSEAIDNIEFVRFPAKPANNKALLLHRVQVVQQEQFIAELLKLDDTHLH